jgi:flavorubredoxin
MAFEPRTPMHLPPLEVAPDTFLLRSAQLGFAAPVSVNLNSLVIRGRQPVLIDTGIRSNRTAWLADMASIVDPADVAWVFLSHDDDDHTGNLAEVLGLCPNATLVTTWAATERMGSAIRVPAERMRWIGDGDSFDVGDRSLHAVRPPVYDSPTTRGLFDSKTGVYWASDAFATPMPAGPVDHVAELDPEAWSGGIATFAHHALSPWLSIVEPARYRASVKRVERLDPTVVVSAHTPVISGPQLGDAFSHIGSLAEMPPPPAPDQSVLEAILMGAAQ